MVFDNKGNPRQEICSTCQPEEFAEKFMDPSDRRPHWGEEVYPNLYKVSTVDGVLRAKDELIQDTVDQWKQTPQDEAEAKKRATRRTQAMTPDEIARACQWGDAVLSPVLEARHRQA
jgi:hypothetical protein